MKKILIGSLVFLAIFLLFAKEEPQSFRLIHADRLSMHNPPSGQILNLYGKVHFFYGDTEFKSDRAVILDGPKIARLSGHVQVQNDSLFLVADSLAYYRIPQQLNLGGRVQLNQTNLEGRSRWMKGDYAIYDQAKNTFSAWSRVKAYDEDESATAYAGYAFWDIGKGYAYLIQEPRVELEQNEGMLLKADKIEYFEEEKKLVATFNVEAKGQDFNAESDFLIYFAENQEAVFLGEPRFYNDFATASAQEFRLELDERKLKRATLIDSCTVYFAIKEEAEKKNWVKATNIVMNFEENRIVDFEADLDVSYYYFQDEDEKNDFFINAATGDVLKAKFGEDNNLKILDMQGSISGSYIFKE